MTMSNIQLLKLSVEKTEYVYICFLFA